MSLRWMCIIAAVAVAVPVSAPVVRADDTGFASMHDLRRERGRLCMVSHYHSGNGSGPTKAAARRAAIRSWVDFTALEYGTDWARFGRARSRGIRCTRTGKRSYDCSVEGRPCR